MRQPSRGTQVRTPAFSAASVVSPLLHASPDSIGAIEGSLHFLHSLHYSQTLPAGRQRIFFSAVRTDAAKNSGRVLEIRWQPSLGDNRLSLEQFCGQLDDPDRLFDVRIHSNGQSVARYHLLLEDSVGDVVGPIAERLRNSGCSRVSWTVTATDAEGSWTRTDRLIRAKSRTQAEARRESLEQRS